MKFIGSKDMPFDYLLSVPSTNNYVIENLSNYSSNFSGVYTFSQTSGRGQRGNLWNSEKDKNIAMTFCLDAKNIKHTSVSFWVPLILRNFLYSLFSRYSFEIKWPNDIICENKKIAGILIEKVRHTYIVGVGINVLQEDFINLPKASSLKNITGQSPDLDGLVGNLMQTYKDNLVLLEQSSQQNLWEQYNKYLFNRGALSIFKIGDNTKEGIIARVSQLGLLEVDFLGQKYSYRGKEIEQIY